MNIKAKLQNPVFLKYLSNSIITGLFALLIIGPAAVLIFSAFRDILTGDTEWLQFIIPSGRRLDLLLRSIGLSLAVACGGAALGLLIGSSTLGIPLKMRMYMRNTILILAVIPPFVHVLSWSLVLNVLNDFLIGLGLAGIPSQGLPASWWVQLMAFMPFGVGISLLGFDSIPRSLVEAGCILDSDFRVFGRIVLPIAMPSVAAGGLFMLLTSLTDYSIPSLFQVNVYSLEIFSEYSASYQAPRAFFLSIPLICIMALAAVIYQSSFRQLVLTPSRDRGEGNVLLRFPPWFAFLQLCAIVIIIMQAVVPLLGLVILSGSVGHITQAVISSSAEISNTMSIAFPAALASLPFAAFWAGKVINKSGWSSAWWAAIILPLILPAPLIGIGLVAVWGKLLPAGAYNSIFMPVAAGVVRFLPYAAVIMLIRFKGDSPALLDAAKVLQKSAFHTLIAIKLPLYAKAILAAAAAVFVLTAGELGATLIVIPPGKETLTIKIYNYLHYGGSETVAGLCLFLLVISILSGFVVVWSTNSKR